MEEFEESALSSYPGDPHSLWKRYIDDTAVKLKRAESDKFFDHINQIDPNIKFTHEECQDNKLPFWTALYVSKRTGACMSTIAS